MKRFFTFKSPASNNANNDNQALLDPKINKAFSETVDGQVDFGKKIMGNEEQHVPCHKRSFNFDRVDNYKETADGNLSLLCRSPPVCRNSYYQHDSPVMERNARATRDIDVVEHCNATDNSIFSRSKRDVNASRHYNATDYTYSPRSSRSNNHSSGGSRCSSPIPLRCRSARLQHVTDSTNTLDLYIDGEQHDIFFPKKDYQDRSLDVCSGKLLRALSTAPTSPTHSMENIRKQPCREASDFHLHSRPKSSRRDIKMKFDTLHSKEFPGKHKFKHQHCDSETSTTVEDIYIDSSEPHPTSFSSSTTRSMLPYYDSSNVLSIENEQSCTYEKGSFNLKIDEELHKKVKEVEHMLSSVSNEDFEFESVHMSDTLNVSALIQLTKSMADDRKSLALELSSQLKSRLAERVSTREALKNARFELDTRTRRLQQEKSDLQSSLENELDRRSTDWSMKLEKFQSEESRLRERVRELAEQNVCLQREISSLKDSEQSIRNRTMSSEIQMQDLSSNLEEARAENHNLHQELSELQERFKIAEENLSSIRNNYRLKEKENKELQKVVVRLQKTCNEQDKSINGLRQAFSDELGKKSIDSLVSRLQMDQVRLTGVEQTLRKETESCRCEVESLRHENMRLLNRLQSNKHEKGFYFSVKLEEELRDRMECLQNQGVSLLNEHSQFCSEVLNLIKCKQFEVDDYINGEYRIKYQSLKRGIENFKRSLLAVAKIADEKANIDALDCQSSQTTECSISKQQYKDQISEDELEIELKSECLLSKLLREKLYSKELEIEQLQSEFASSVRTHDILQSEIQRLQDELSCLTHKSKDVEIQMISKDENINQLQQDLQECTKELTSTRSKLLAVSDERDHMWNEVKNSKETIMLLNFEVKSLKQKIEALDERVLIKEGEISILKDSLTDEPFNIICSPKLVKEFCL